MLDFVFVVVNVPEMVALGTILSQNSVKLATLTMLCLQ